MITDVHHVGIAVRDLDSALTLYSEALSLPVVKRGEARARGAAVAVLAAGGSYLEFIQPTTDDSPFARFIEERAEGLHHIALWSNGVDDQVATLRSLSVSLEDHEPRDGFTGRLSYLRPEAFDGAVVEVVEPAEDQRGHAPGASVTRIDHVVLRVPSATAVIQHMEEWFGVATKRTFERNGHTFAFMRPGDVVIEVIGPTDGGEPGTGRIAGLAFEVKGIDDLAADLKTRGYPIGEPHPALQGGRIVSGAFGVPLAFIDFTDSPGPPKRDT
jgi:methylmalonyl-CoA/ethylmalonyl-CoA epimerase